MEIVTKVMEKSWKFVGKNVYEPCMMQCISAMLDRSVKENSALISELDNTSHCQEEQDEDIMGETDHHPSVDLKPFITHYWHL